MGVELSPLPPAGIIDEERGERMERAKDGKCPRCGEAVPSAEYRGQYPGALSRVADVEICSLCGEDEALASLLTAGTVNGLVPVSEWPVPRIEIERRMSPLFSSR